MKKTVAYVRDGLPTYDVIKTAPYLGSSLPPKVATYYRNFIKYLKCWLSMAKLG